MNYNFLNTVGKEGRICTVNCVKDNRGVSRFVTVTENDNHHFSDLTEAEQKMAIRWLRYNILPSTTPLEDHSSYCMKHVLEKRTNIYMTNNQFKEAMLRCDFAPVDTDELNWHFFISKTSPIFVEQADKLAGLPMLGSPMNYRLGEWEYENGSWQCSECGSAPNEENCIPDPDAEPTFSYCPHCGAEMNIAKGARS